MFNLFKKRPKYQILPDIGHSYVMTENGEPMPVFYRPNSGLFCSTPLSENDTVYFLNIRRPIVMDVENVAPIEIPNDLPTECDGIIFKNFGKYKITEANPIGNRQASTTNSNNAEKRALTRGMNRQLRSIPQPET